MFSTDIVTGMYDPNTGDEIIGPFLTTDGFDSKDWPKTINGQKIYLPWGTVSSPGIYWSAGDNVLENKLSEDVNDYKAYLKGGAQTANYWLRSPSDNSISVLSTSGSGNIAPKITNQDAGLRPLLKLDPSSIIFASKIVDAEGDGMGAINKNEPYYFVSGEGADVDASAVNYKLTVLGGDVGTLNFSPSDVSTSSSSITLSNIDADAGSFDLAGDGTEYDKYTINYKVVGDSNGERKIFSYGKIDAKKSNNSVTVNTNIPNGTYKVYLWLQKNNIMHSFEATGPKVFTLTVNKVADTSHSSGASSGTSSNVEILLLVNGVAESAATTNTQKMDDKTIATITVDDEKLEEKLHKVGDNALITINAQIDANVIIAKFNGQSIKNMENKKSVIHFKTQDATYIIPASQINIDTISEKIGQGVNPQDITVNVKISDATNDNGVKIARNDYQIVTRPVEFEISCVGGDKTVAVSNFADYVERTIAIPSNLDAKKITTAVVLGADGTVRHVPTFVYQQDGKYYAKINSLTNSVYALIYNNTRLSDTTSKWYDKVATEMTSRKILNGYEDGTFKGDSPVTRAEFAAIIVRALGINPCGVSNFSDVSSENWYYEYVSAAYENEIVNGYSNNKFDAGANITREEAMAMIHRASKICKLNSVENFDTSAFSDLNKVSNWAMPSVEFNIQNQLIVGDNLLINPKDNITRAEAAIVVLRMLQKSKFIDIR